MWLNNIDFGDWSWYTSSVLIALSWTIVFRGPTFSRKSRKRFIGETIILFCVLIICRIAVMSVVQRYFSNFTTYIWMIVLGAITAFYIRFCSTYRRRTNILLWNVLFTAILSINAIAGQCGLIFTQFSHSSRFFSLSNFQLILSVINLGDIAAAFYLRKFNFDDFATVPSGGFKMIALGTISVALFQFMEGLYFMSDSGVIATLLVAYICTLAMVMAAIHTMYTLCLEQESIIELQAERQRLLSEKEMTLLMETSLEDLRAIRHDLKNQYSYMDILLSEKRYDELREYFGTISENLPQSLNYVDCGNRTMNTVLNMEFNKLRTDRISLEHQLVVPPVLPFSDEDICGIVSNLLDNAIEECRRLLQNGEERVKLRIEIYPHNRYLYIMCRNTTDHTEFSRNGDGLRTTKESRELHGYGTRIVAKLAAKYNGFADYSLENGEFAAKVVLYMTEGEGNEG